MFRPVHQLKHAWVQIICFLLISKNSEILKVQQLHWPNLHNTEELGPKTFTNGFRAGLYNFFGDSGFLFLVIFDFLTNYRWAKKNMFFCTFWSLVFALKLNFWPTLVQGQKIRPDTTPALFVPISDLGKVLVWPWKKNDQFLHVQTRTLPRCGGEVGKRWR